MLKLLRSINLIPTGKAIRNPRVLMLRNQRDALLINTFNGMLTTALLLKSTATLWMMPLWLGILCLVNTARWIVGTVELSDSQKNRVSDLPIIMTGACGLTWAALPFLIQPAYDPLSASIVAFLVAGMTAGAAISNASEPKSVLAFVIPPISSMALFFLMQPGLRDKSMALFLILYTVALIGWSKRVKQTIDEANRHSRESREALTFIAEQTKTMRERMSVRNHTETKAQDTETSMDTSARSRRAS